MRILVVEDSPIQSKLICLALESSGLEAYSATTVEQALVHLEQPGIDAILLDLSLPDSSGIETLHRIKSRVPYLPIVIFTAQDDKTLALEAVKNGAQDYVVKGVAGDHSVVRCIMYAVERNRVELALRKGERRLKAILENSYDAFISMDSQWRITDWNSQAACTFGWQKEEVVGEGFSAIFPERVRRHSLVEIQRYFSDNQGDLLKTTEEVLAQHHDGHEFPIEIGIFRIKEESDYLFCAFVRDITERKRSSDQLERLVQERTAKLTQSNGELRQFAKIASHDLQEPLRAVQGFANLLAENTKNKLDQDCSEFVD